MSVLCYVKNKSKHSHTFVAKRITTIRDGSTPDQCYHVECAMNPGDLASRGLSAAQTGYCGRSSCGCASLNGVN